MGPADSSPNFFIVAAASAVGAALSVLVVTIGIDWYNHNLAGTYDSYGLAAYNEANPATANCNVVGIQVHGTIVGSRSEIPVHDVIVASDGSGKLHTPNYTVASDVVYALLSARGDPSIKAVLLDIDSSGGDGQAGEEIAVAVSEVGKPTAALIHGLGLSAAYMAASAADKVFSYKSSTIGSIGVTYSYLNEYEKNKKEGIQYEALSSGPFKDMFSPDKELTREERELIERDLKLLHENFVAIVAENRNLPIEKVSALADGSSLIGTLALENKLVDSLEGDSGVEKYLSGVIGQPVSVCWHY